MKRQRATGVPTMGAKCFKGARVPQGHVAACIPEFINMYCEMDAKHTTSMAQFIAGLYEYIVHVKQDRRWIDDINTLLCAIQFVFQHVYPNNLDIHGMQTPDNPFELLFITGLRMRGFP